jgi:hypothetical protein
VAEQIYRLLSDLLPCPESIVAKDQVVTALLELGIVLRAIPFSRLRRRLRIVVADGQVLAAVELP